MTQADQHRKGMEITPDVIRAFTDAIDLAGGILERHGMQVSEENILGLIGKIASQQAYESEQLQPAQEQITEDRPEQRLDSPTQEKSGPEQDTYPQFIVKPGESISFILPYEELPIGEANHKILTGITLVVIPILAKRQSLLEEDEDADVSVQTGPPIFIQQVDQMRYDERMSFIEETAQKLAMNDPSPADLEDKLRHYLSELEASSNKVKIHSELEAGGTNDDDSALLMSRPYGIEYDVVYPYLLLNEETDELDLKFSQNGQPRLVRGKILPLGVIALADNIVSIIPPILDVFTPGEFPAFQIQATRPPQNNQDEKDLLLSLLDKPAIVIETHLPSQPSMEQSLANNNVPMDPESQQQNPTFRGILPTHPTVNRTGRRRN